MPIDVSRPTPSPPSSPTAVLPTPTSTNLPPLTAHTWAPGRVLVRYNVSGGDGGCCFHDPPPDLTILSDGTVVLTTFEADSFRLFTTTLSQQRLCSLLNSIDRTGFLDYDPAPYIQQWAVSGPDGGSAFTIQINAWRSNRVNLPGLGLAVLHRDDWLADCPECSPLPDPPPSLRNIYLLLDEIDFHPVAPYEPDRILLFADTPLEGDITELAPPSPWPFATPSLSSLLPRTHYFSDGLLLSGAVAQRVFSAFQVPLSGFGQLFTEGEATYLVFARPLLPGEDDSDPYKPPAQIHCDPADGLWPGS